jgi:hypothetical protein
MYPHERSLVKRLKDNSFALIGVNSDPKEKVLAAMESENITWPSFWDGGSTGGPIASRWNVRAWPTIYVLDSKGTIRFKNVRGKAMDKAVETLLAEMGEEFPPAEEEKRIPEARLKENPAKADS